MASKHKNFTIKSRDAGLSPHFYLRIYSGEYEDPHAHVYSKEGKTLGRLALNKKTPKNYNEIKPFHGALSKSVLLNVFSWVKEKESNWSELFNTWKELQKI